MDPRITLTITFDPASKQVNVNGPIKDRMLSYAMLKLAEKAIDEDHARDKEKGAEIVPVRGNGDAVIRALNRR
jgi:hypothetical protein